MNKEKLEIAKEVFYNIYPNGFNDEKMADIKKKHPIEKMSNMTRELLQIDEFDNPDKVLDNWILIVKRSSMVSVFEKVKLKDLIKVLNPDEKEILANGLKELLFGNKEFGFQSMVDILSFYKLAKWTVLTISSYYLYPEDEVFIKPTTTKAAIAYFELEGVKYSAKPTYEFYLNYKKEFLKLKKAANVTTDNAVFGGFIMITTGI